MNEKDKKFLDNIRDLLEIDKNQDALKLLNNYKTEDSYVLAEIYLFLGVIERRLGNFEKSIEWYEKITLDSGEITYAKAQFNLGNIYYLKHDYSEAIEYWASINLDLDVGIYARAQIKIAQCYEDKGDIDTAKNYYKKLKLDWDEGIYADAQLNLGRLAVLQNKKEDANKYYESIKLEWNARVYAKAQLALGSNVLTEEGDSTAAKSYWSKIKLEYGEDIYAAALCRLAMEEKDSKKANRLWNTIELNWNASEYAWAQIFLGISKFGKRAVYHFERIEERWSATAYKLAQENLLLIAFEYIDKRKFSESQLVLSKIKHKALKYESNILYEICKLSGKSRSVFIECYQKVDRIKNLLQVTWRKGNTECLRFAHYTKHPIAYKILGYDDGNAIPESALRLGITDAMNDPTEGLIIDEWLQINDITKNRFGSRDYQSFAGCFSFNHDSLNQFRLYGKQDEIETSGVSIVINSSFFLGEASSEHIKTTDMRQFIDQNSKESSWNIDDQIPLYDKPNGYKLPLYSCIYYDPLSNYFRLARRSRITFYRQDKKYFDNNTDDKIQQYEERILKVEKQIDSDFCDLKDSVQQIKLEIKNIEIQVKQGNVGIEILHQYILLLNNILLPIRFLVKHAAFEEEDECRVIYIAAPNDDRVKQENGRLFIEYSEPVAPHIAKVYLGEGAKKERPFMERALRLIQDKHLINPERRAEVRDSDNPFRVNR